MKKDNNFGLQFFTSNEVYERFNRIDSMLIEIYRLLMKRVDPTEKTSYQLYLDLLDIPSVGPGRAHQIVCQYKNVDNFIKANNLHGSLREWQVTVKNKYEEIKKQL